MKVTVFGAVDSLGQNVIRQSLDAGHDVTVYARPALAPADPDPAVQLVRAEPGDRGAVRTAVAGADAVLCAIGCAAETPTPIASALRVVLDVMADAGVRRLVAVSSAPAAPPHQKSRFDLLVKHPVLFLLHRERLTELRRMEAMLAQSDCDWTVFRPPNRLTTGPAVGKYRTALDSKLRRTHALSRADLAVAMVDAVGDESLVGHFVTISY
ncbi:MAG: NAD(P)H-binding protein [Mycobacteriaceae bacterium]|nr:NAD(P)H-binding protein [Mycobacteriaceae bacterium]